MSNKEQEYEFGERLKDDSQLTFLFETDSRFYWDKRKNKAVRFRMAFFLCECGGVTETYITDVKRGKSKRCSSNIHKFGTTRKKWGWMVEHPLYTTYKGMVARCYYGGESYKNYGARGIEVCDRWLGSDGFVNFVSDMGSRPEGYTLDRVDTNGDYKPSNCRWADLTTQGYNKRLQSNSTTGCHGVSFDKKNNKYIAYIKRHGVSKTLGRFSTFEDAVEVRRKAEIEYYGYNNNYWMGEEDG